MIVVSRVTAEGMTRRDPDQNNLYPADPQQQEPGAAGNDVRDNLQGHRLPVASGIRC
jgi:hypothetical protein